MVSPFGQPRNIRPNSAAYSAVNMRVSQPSRCCRGQARPDAGDRGRRRGKHVERTAELIVSRRSSASNTAVKAPRTNGSAGMSAFGFVRRSVRRREHDFESRFEILTRKSGVSFRVADFQDDLDVTLFGADSRERASPQ